MLYSRRENSTPNVLGCTAESHYNRITSLVHFSKKTIPRQQRQVLVEWRSELMTMLNPLAIAILKRRYLLLYVRLIHLLHGCLDEIGILGI
jgi:hypothetical protein